VSALYWDDLYKFARSRTTFRFRDLSAASAMAVRSLGPVHDDECCLAIGHWLVAEQTAEGWERPVSSSMVNVIAIIGRRSGAMSLTPC
jgi:hypothetical protein